jgi:hypothetical protein
VAIKQAVAIIKNEGDFIDISPLGKAIAAEQTQPIATVFESGRWCLSNIRTMIWFRKSWHRALVETWSDDPESCDGNAARLPNSSAGGFKQDWPQSSSRVQSRLAVKRILDARIDKLFERNTTALILKELGAAR